MRRVNVYGRPSFILIIWDNETDSILFMGRVMDPTK
ncbi:MAG: hypothetical protein K5793_02120 [Nitrosarchaeum sp.]|nr:hypothetical protein [Nitrosarchaeum sp.]